MQRFLVPVLIAVQCSLALRSAFYWDRELRYLWIVFSCKLKLKHSFINSILVGFFSDLQNVITVKKIYLKNLLCVKLTGTKSFAIKFELESLFLDIHVCIQYIYAISNITVSSCWFLQSSMDTCTNIRDYLWIMCLHDYRSLQILSTVKQSHNIVNLCTRVL